MNALEEIEQNLDIILAKTKEKLNATIAVFYDFDVCKLQNFVSREELEALVESALSIQTNLKETRQALEAYINAREIYLACLGIDEKNLDEMPITKKGDC
jgi:hypothetical protein